ncbi:MAG: hypothetical protein EXX96DRAFT_488755, partial [Benjaminiella poitrasii]
IPHSVAFLNSIVGDPLYLLVGSRQGSILCLDVNITLTKDDESIVSTCLNNRLPHVYNIGFREVKLSISCYEGNRAVYALSEQLWKITATANQDNNRNINIQIDPILLPKFQKGSIDAFVPIDYNSLLLQQEQRPPFNNSAIATVVDNKLQLFQLKLKSRTNTTKIKLGETPTKVIYDKSLNCIIAITTKKELGERKNYVRLIDPSR